MSESHLDRTRAFFAPRAAEWDDRFPDDDAAYTDAIAALAPRPGGVVVDLGCGTGRALPHLRGAVGRDGTVLAVDVTLEMLRVALAKRRGETAALVLADALRLPLRRGRVDAIFAAGLVAHVPDAREFLRELNRIACPGGRLALFHPIGRAALAARHQRALRPDELLDPTVLPGVLAASGWVVEHIDDADHRYLALASRLSGSSGTPG